MCSRRSKSTRCSRNRPRRSKPEAEAEDWDKQLDTLRKQDEEWREYFSQGNQPTAPYNPEAAERRQFLFDSQVEAPHLSDHLMRQLTLSNCNQEMVRVGEEIIGNIDDAGFLKVQLVEVAQSSRVEYPVAQATLDLIQTFDPVGVAARDLRECLLIQIKRLGKGDDLEAQMVGNHLAELGRKKYQDIARVAEGAAGARAGRGAVCRHVAAATGLKFQFRRQAEHRAGRVERAENGRRVGGGDER